MAAIVNIVNRCGLGIEVCCRNQLCISRFFHFNSYLKQLYISNKIECFSNKNGCGVTHIEVFKRRASLGYI